jgi:hypothetical protein
VAVPATLVSKGIHVAIDPLDDLTAGASYEVRVGGNLADLGGTRLAATTVAVTAVDSLGGKAPIPQVLRTRQPGDPGPELSRSGAERNIIAIDKPLIGRELSTVLPAAVAAELGDPKVLGGPIAFTIRRGQRLATTGFNVRLGGEIPEGLSTGDILIEFLTDAGGRMYRNPYQPADQRPENARAPLFVDLSMDVAVYTIDATGNAVIAQTVLGVQATGTAIATEGVLALESVLDGARLARRDAGTDEPRVELITDPAAPSRPTPRRRRSSRPRRRRHERARTRRWSRARFDEPIDLDRRRGGRHPPRDQRPAGAVGAREPRSDDRVRHSQRLAYSTSYNVIPADVADVAGNARRHDADRVRDAHVARHRRTDDRRGSSSRRAVRADRWHRRGRRSLHRWRRSRSAVPTVRARRERTDRRAVQPAGEPEHDDPRDELQYRQRARRGARWRRRVRRGGPRHADPARSGPSSTRAPWATGTRYRLALIPAATPAATRAVRHQRWCREFDPLNGNESGDAGGASLVIDYVGRRRAARGLFAR